MMPALQQLDSSPHVLTLRDMYSVHLLRERLKAARTVMVVGNGGIALDLMSDAAKGVATVERGMVVEAFFDRDSAEFLLEHFYPPAIPPSIQDAAPVAEPMPEGCLGEALGPNWIKRISIPSAAGGESEVTVETECEVASVLELGSADKVSVSLSNGHQYNVDVVISAIGVDPSLTWIPPEVARGRDGGLRVNLKMQTNHADVYAAGDCCSIEWGDEQSHHWFQRRLWSQAKAMGIYAAQCMAGVGEEAGMPFELFTHVTHLLQQKVILLGQYALHRDPEADVVCHCRTWKGEHGHCYAKVVLRDGRVEGAVLIGNTELEEMMENLILDGLDVSRYGEHLLDPDIDHVFD